MTILDIPFMLRVGLLLAFGLVIAGIDLLQHGRKANRWREYGLLFVMAAIGGLCGFATDFITSSLSPEYFIVGKGMRAHERLSIQAMLLGAQAGFSAGAILACVFLYANTLKPRYKSLSFIQMIWPIRKPIVCAIVCATIFAMIVSLLTPIAQRSDLRFVLTTEQIPRFTAVWAIHIGIYMGAVVGTICATRAIWIARKTAIVRTHPG